MTLTWGEKEGKSKAAVDFLLVASKMIAFPVDCQITKKNQTTTQQTKFLQNESNSSYHFSLSHSLCCGERVL